jgi:AraC-type transcriptional regulator
LPDPADFGRTVIARPPVPVFESNVSLDELRGLITQYAGRPGPAIDGLQLSVVERPAPPSASIADPVMALVAQGTKRLTLGDQIYDYGAGQYLVVSVDLPVTGHYPDVSPDRPFLGLGLTLKPAAIASLLLEAGPAARDGGTRATPASRGRWSARSASRTAASRTSAGRSGASGTTTRR